LHRFNEVISLGYDAMEFFWKSLRHLQCHDAPTLLAHMPDNDTWNSFIPNLTNFLISTQEEKDLKLVFAKHNPKWEINPETRQHAHYYSRMFGKPEAENLLNDCRCLICTVLAKINRKIHMVDGGFTVGILDGYFGIDKQSEKPCLERPWADVEKGGVSGWRVALSEKKIKIEEIAVNSISPKFSIIINPFGECYPEFLAGPNRYPGYDMIKDYIYSGGAFVTAGGNPFHYSFDVSKGERKDTSTVVPAVPIDVTSAPDKEGNLRLTVNRTTLLFNMIFPRDFGAVTTMDLSNEQKGPWSVNLFQSEEDRKYWDCNMELNRLRVFRSLNPKNSRQLIAIMRARLAGKEVFPVGFVPYGHGLLFHIGLTLDLRGEREFDIATAAVTDGLINNFKNYLPC